MYEAMAHRRNCFARPGRFAPAVICSALLICALVSMKAATAAEAGTGTEAGPSTVKEQSSKKPAPDVEMPDWMTRLPPWMAPITPKIGSPAWEREEAENARQEGELRRAIEGVCRAC